MYHGTKWQHWLLVNLDGTMEEFGLFRQCKAAAVRDEIAHFWELRGCATSKEGPSSSRAESMAPTPAPTCEASFGALCDVYVERDLLKFMETRPSDEELCEWLLRPDVLYAGTP